jgi:TetR/AcrR family acrAB operon transcriptional repressor
MPPKSDRHERETRILDAALKLIVQYGYDKTSMNDIAQEAHVSKGAIYLHFDSKDALFERLLWREGLAYAELWLARIDSDPAPVTFASIFSHLLYALAQNALISALFKRDRRVLGAYMRNSPDRIQAALGIRQSLLAELQEAGAVRKDIPPDVLAVLVTMIAYALVSMEDVLPPGAPSLEAVIEGYGVLLDRALTPEVIADPERAKLALHRMMDVARAIVAQKQGQ